MMGKFYRFAEIIGFLEKRDFSGMMHASGQHINGWTGCWQQNSMPVHISTAAHLQSKNITAEKKNEVSTVHIKKFYAIVFLM